MTLSFIVSSMKRHGRLVAVCAFFGLLGGLALPFMRTGVYLSEAVILLEPPTQSSGIPLDRDEYVAGQLSLLAGTELLGLVSEQVPGSTSRDIRNASTVSLEPPSAVKISAIDPDPKRAQLIATQYAEQYLGDQNRRELEGTEAELLSVNSQLESVNKELVDITAALARNREDVVAISKLQTLETRKARLDDERSTLESRTLRPSASELIQPAELPKTKEGLSPVEWALVGLFAGVFMGVAAAVAWAANSGQLLDAQQLEDILGVPVAARLPVVSALSKEPSAGLEILPAAVASRIDRLCVRAEGVGPSNGRQLRVAVAGTGAECGVTTLALMLGARMAQSRMTVGLMDADPLNPWISRRLSKSVAEGVRPRDGRRKPTGSDQPSGTSGRSRRGPARSSAAKSGAAVATQEKTPKTPLSESDPDTASNGTTASAPSAALELARLDLTTLATSVERLVVIGEGPRAEQAFQRSTLETVWRGLDDVDVDIVVFDGGSMMDAALSVRLCQLVDVIILLVPLARQNVDQLRVVRRLFDGRPVEILPVVTDVVARRQLD